MAETLRGLVVRKKLDQDVTFSDLQARSGDVVHAKRWQQYWSGAAPMINMPSEDTVRAIAKALDVTPADVRAAIGTDLDRSDG